jgi:hypothetical protein
VRLVLLIAAVVGAWLVHRWRRADDRRVVVAWEDGSEVALEQRSPERERLVEIAGRALP